MATHYRTKALILDKREFREADRFFTFFTKEYGRVEALAKGERKIESKLRGGLELFYLSEISFIQGRYWKTLVDASLIDNFNGIREELPKLKTASLIGREVSTLVKGQEQDQDLWQLLLFTFKRLNKSPRIFLTYQYFFWRFVSHLGYRPQLYDCVDCGDELNPDQLYFSANQGGLVCRNCKEGLNQKTDPGTVKVIRAILEQDWQEVKKLRVNKQHQKLNELSNFYFSYLKSL
ncbi:MAG: DNA repair protein RecO [Candidatus Paceibacterota bacterium]